jgi:protein tyrosine/serine phosphatase
MTGSSKGKTLCTTERACANGSYRILNIQARPPLCSAAFVKTYREFITLPSANAAFHQLFVDLGDKDQLPALFHCTTGNDRTGWASAALLTLLGIPEDEVYKDYLQRSFPPISISSIASLRRAANRRYHKIHLA